MYCVLYNKAIAYLVPFSIGNIPEEGEGEDDVEDGLFDGDVDVDFHGAVVVVCCCCSSVVFFVGGHCFGHTIVIVVVVVVD